LPKFYTGHRAFLSLFDVATAYAEGDRERMSLKSFLLRQKDTNKNKKIQIKRKKESKGGNDNSQYIESKY